MSGFKGIPGDSGRHQNSSGHMGHRGLSPAPRTGPQMGRPVKNFIPITSNHIRRSQDDDRADVERHAENSARTAFSEATFTTEGVGSIIIPSVIKFDATFIEKPHITTGFEIMRLPDRSLYELPGVTAGVMRWDKNAKGHYVGAYMWARVSCDPLLNEETGAVLDQEAVNVNPPKPHVLHYLTATGLAYKELPDSIVSILDME